MANREARFKLKRSNVSNKIPTISDLFLGEVALNTADVKMYAAYTGGLTGATEVREIGWNRLSTESGGTVNGDVIINSGLTATTFYGDQVTNKLTYSNDFSPFSGNEIPSAQWVLDQIGTGGTGTDVFVTGMTWDSTGNTLTLERNDDVNIVETIDITSISGKSVGDSFWKNWSQWYINGSATATTTPVSTPIKVGVNPPVTWSTNSKGFGFSAATLTFTADTLQEFHITVSMTAEADSNNQLYSFWVEKNGVLQDNLIIESQFGTQRQAVSLTGIVELAPNDYVDLWMMNNTANKNLIIKYINLSIVQI